MKIRTNVQVGSRGLDVAGLRELAKNNPQEFAQRADEIIEAGEFTWTDVADLKGFYRAFADIPVQAQVAKQGGEFRTIDTAAFPLLAGNLSLAGVTAAYEAMPKIGGELVTDMETNKKRATFVNIVHSSKKNLETAEGEDFPMAGAGQEPYDIVTVRKGLRTAITQELLEENDTPGIMQRLNYLGEKMAKEVEIQTLKSVTDHDGSASSGAEPYALHFDGSGTALFTTVNTTQKRLPSTGNRVTNNALVDVSDLDKARIRLASMTDSEGDRIPLDYANLVLLVPDALVGVAAQIRGSQMEPGNINALNNWGPQGAWRPRILTTPFLDALSASAWYLGNFKKQFKRCWKINMENLSLSDPKTYLTKRVAFESRVAWAVGVGAVDQGVYVVQNLSGTTAPKDE